MECVVCQEQCQTCVNHNNTAIIHSLCQMCFDNIRTNNLFIINNNSYKCPCCRLPFNTLSNIPNNNIQNNIIQNNISDDDFNEYYSSLKSVINFIKNELYNYNYKNYNYKQKEKIENEILDFKNYIFNNLEITEKKFNNTYLEKYYYEKYNLFHNLDKTNENIIKFKNLYYYEINNEIKKRLEYEFNEWTN